LPTDNLETLNYTFDQLTKQGANPVAMYDYIRERAGEGIDIKEMARVGQNQYDISKFAPTVEASNAGPVKVVKPAMPKGPTVTTKGVPLGLTTSQSLGQKAAAIANREPLPKPRPVMVAPQTPKPTVKPKAVTKPTPVGTTRTTRAKPTSASMQIRAMQNTVPDVIRIQPGMSLPSTSLIQGI
jgi:hypothetical protein